MCIAYIQYPRAHSPPEALQMVLRRVKGRSVWIYQSEVNGKTWSRSTGQTDKKLALKEIPRLKEIAESYRIDPRDPLTLSNAIKAEVQRLKIDVSPNQGERVEFSLKNFLNYAGDIKLEKITTELLERFQRYRLKKKMSLSTVNRELIYLVRMLRINGFHIQKPSPKPGKVTGQRALTNDELAKFFEACPARLKPLYLLMLATGARQAELVPSPIMSTHKPLLKSEVDFEHSLIRLRTAKQREGAAKANPKVRVIPLPDWVIEPLKWQMARSKTAFVFKRLFAACRQFDDILKKAGIPKYDALGQKLTGHSFRHTYATLMAEMVGHNAFALKAALGHTRISTTERYCHPTAPILEIALPEPKKEVPRD